MARLAGLAHEDRAVILASLHHTPKRPEPPRAAELLPELLPELPKRPEPPRAAELLPELLPELPKRPEPPRRRRHRLRPPGRLSVWLPDE